MAEYINIGGADSTDIGVRNPRPPSSTSLLAVHGGHAAHATHVIIRNIATSSLHCVPETARPMIIRINCMVSMAFFNISIMTTCCMDIHVMALMIMSSIHVIMMVVVVVGCSLQAFAEIKAGYFGQRGSFSWGFDLGNGFHCGGGFFLF